MPVKFKRWQVWWIPKIGPSTTARKSGRNGIYSITANFQEIKERQTKEGERKRRLYAHMKFQKLQFHKVILSWREPQNKQIKLGKTGKETQAIVAGSQWK